jgi:hypothetical protein
MIDHDNVTCLNEEVVGSAKTVLRALDDKNKPMGHVVSNDGDPELIIQVPFTAGVKIRSLCLCGEAGVLHPSKVHLFINRDDIDFETGHEITPTQTLALIEDPEGVIDYPLKSSKFGSVQSLTLFITEGFGGEDCSTRINFLGFKGVNMKHKRAVVEAVYESRPMAQDTRARSDVHAASMSGLT